MHYNIPCNEWYCKLSFGGAVYENKTVYKRG